MGIEQRREGRNECFLRASIFIERENRSVEAEVTDISSGGMRVKVADTRTVPDYFVLSVPRRHLVEHVRVVRRGKQDLGVVIRTMAPPNAQTKR